MEKINKITVAFFIIVLGLMAVRVGIIAHIGNYLYHTVQNPIEESSNQIEKIQAENTILFKSIEDLKGLNSASEKLITAQRVEIEAALEQVAKLELELSTLRSLEITIPTPITGEGFNPLNRVKAGWDPVVKVRLADGKPEGITRKGETVQLN